MRRARLAMGALWLLAGPLITSPASAAAVCPAVAYQGGLVAAAAALQRVPADVAQAARTVAALEASTARPPGALAVVANDLAAVPPAVSDASARLTAMAAALAYPAHSICTSDTAAAQQALGAVYAQPALRRLDAAPASGGFLDTVGRAVLSVLGGAAGALGPVGALLLLAALVAVVVGLGLRRARRQAVAATARLAEAPTATVDDDPAAEWRAAESAAAAGAFREATRRAFRAALLDVARRGGVFVDPTWTTRELLERCRADPETLVALAVAAADFDRAWYSGREVSGVDWHRAAAHCATVRTLAARRMARR